jgi:integrase
MTSRGRSYQAHPRHPLTGKQFTISARTPRELEAYLHRIDVLREELRLEMRTADDVDRALRRIVHGPVTFERAALSYAAREDLAKSTSQGVLSFVSSAGSALSGRELDDLTAPVVQTWLDRMVAQGAARSSVGKCWRTLRAIVRHAALQGWIGRAPWGTARPRLRGRVGVGREAARDIGELTALLSSARALGPPELEAKIATAALLGLRQGEIAGLRWSDVDEQTMTVTIARQYVDRPTKQRKEVPLRGARELFVILAAHRESLDEMGLFSPTGPVFPDPRVSTPGDSRAYANGECLTTRSLRAVVKHAHLPNVPRWSPHSLRDSFVTLEARSQIHQGDLKSLAERSRHASVGSLVRYLQSASREPAPPGFELEAGARLLEPKK